MEFIFLLISAFPDQLDGHEHNVNEQIELSRFKTRAMICLEAM